MCGLCIRGYSLHETRVLINTKTEPSNPHLLTSSRCFKFYRKAGEQKKASRLWLEDKKPPFFSQFPAVHTAAAVITGANALNGLRVRFYNK